MCLLLIFMLFSLYNSHLKQLLKYVWANVLLTGRYFAPSVENFSLHIVLNCPAFLQKILNGTYQSAQFLLTSSFIKAHELLRSHLHHFCFHCDFQSTESTHCTCSFPNKGFICSGTWFNGGLSELGYYPPFLLFQGWLQVARCRFRHTALHLLLHTETVAASGSSPPAINRCIKTKIAMINISTWVMF